MLMRCSNYATSLYVIMEEIKMFKKFNINENLSDLDLIFCSISKRKIINKDVEHINTILAHLRSNSSKSKQKLMITFEGYDNDQREVYEIKEIRRYVRKIFDHNQDLFYFLTEVMTNNKIILACLGIPKYMKRVGDISVKLGYDVDDKTRRKIMFGVITASKNDEKDAKEIVAKLFNYESWEW